MLSAVIIDDVPEAIETLKADLETYCPEVSVIGEAEGVVSGVKLIRKVSPDVVFLDIQMRDGSGFDLLEILGEINFKLIFTTASDAFAIKAFKFSATDYLLKPVDPDELMQAVEKAGKALPGAQDSLNLLRESMKGRQPHTRLALHTMEKIYIAPINEIVRCESSGNYTIFYLQDKRQLLVTKTLKEFELLLKAHAFFRVHQSHLVNSEQIKEFVKSEGGYLVMNDGAEVPVSSRKRAAVIEMIGEL